MHVLSRVGGAYLWTTETVRYWPCTLGLSFVSLELLDSGFALVLRLS